MPIVDILTSLYFLAVRQVTVYQCLEGGVIAVLQSYIDEDVRSCKHTVVPSVLYICYFIYLKNFCFFHVLCKSER